MKLKHKPILDNLTIEMTEVEKEKVSEGGIVLATSSEEKKREQGGVTLVKVLDIGDCCWQGFDNSTGNAVAACKPGDIIMMAAYAGQKFPHDDSASKEEQEYTSRCRLIKDTDVLTVYGGDS